MKISFRLSILIMLAALILSCTLSTRAFAQAAQFRGHAEVTTVLSQRLSPAGTPLALLPYVAKEPGLLNLLGAWTQFGGIHVFSNGLPNAVNMLLWYSTLYGVAKDVGARCNQPAGLALNTHFTRVLMAICAWPADSAKSEETMLAFWLGVMGYSAPEEEYQAWRTFFLTSSYKDKSGEEAVSAMTLAILMNPFLLLQN